MTHQSACSDNFLQERGIGFGGKASARSFVHDLAGLYICCYAMPGGEVIFFKPLADNQRESTRYPATEKDSGKGASYHAAQIQVLKDFH